MSFANFGEVPRGSRVSPLSPLSIQGKKVVLQERPVGKLSGRTAKTKEQTSPQAQKNASKITNATQQIPTKQGGIKSLFTACLPFITKSHSTNVMSSKQPVQTITIEVKPEQKLEEEIRSRNDTIASTRESSVRSRSRSESEFSSSSTEGLRKRAFSHIKIEEEGGGPRRLSFRVGEVAGNELGIGRTRRGGISNEGGLKPWSEEMLRSSLTNDERVFEFSLKTKTEARLPKGSEKNLKEWLKFNKQILENNTGRIPYTEKQIGEAIDQFEKQFNCLWRDMKDNCSNPVVFQVINDIRSMSLDKFVFNPVKEEASKELEHLLKPFGNNFVNEFSGLDENGKLKSPLSIMIAGSSDLKSDCDAGLGLRKCRDRMFEELSKREERLEFLKNNGGESKEIGDLQNSIQKMERAIEEFAGQLESLETKYSDLANELSTAETNGATWAGVFDSNFYTENALTRASERNQEMKRCGQQQIGALLMKLRTCKGNYDNFEVKARAGLGALTPAERQRVENQFEAVSALNQELDYKFSRKVIEISISPEMAVSEREKLEELLENGDPESINEISLTLIQADPDVRVRASDALHAEFKMSAHSNETIRATLFFVQKNLDKSVAAGQTEAFIKIFRDGIQSAIQNLQEKLNSEQNSKGREILNYRIADFETLATKLNRYDESRVKQLMSAYSDRRSVEARGYNLDDTRIFLEGARKELDKLTSELNGGLSSGGMEKIQAKITNRSAEINQELEKRLKNEPDLKLVFDEKGSIGDKVNRLIQSVDEELDLISKQKISLKEEHGGQNWLIAGMFESERDSSLLEMQLANIKGMLFAQEAHASIDAFNKIVGDQMDRMGAHTISALVNAYSEVNAFHDEHQGNKPPWGKMVESSKYAQREVGIAEDIAERCRIMGIQGPNLDPQGVGKFTLSNLKLYNAEMLKIRKDATSSINDKKIRAEELTRKYFEIDSLDDKMVEKINNRYTEINVELFNWSSQLPLHVQNARY